MNIFDSKVKNKFKPFGKRTSKEVAKKYKLFC